MTEEEKKAIEFVDNFIDGHRLYNVNTNKMIIPYKYNGGQRYVDEQTLNSIQTLLNLIQKQQEEIEKLIKTLEQSMQENIEKVKYFEKLIQSTKEETHDRRSWLRTRDISLTNYEYARKILKILEVK